MAEGSDADHSDAFHSSFLSRGCRQEFLDARASVPDRGAKPEGPGPRIFIISLFEGRKHHVIFLEDNQNNGLETVYF